MKRYLLFLSFSALLSCSDQSSQKVETNQTSAEPETPAKVSSKKSIVFFGNSLTAGYGLDISEAFPAKIQEIVDSLALDYQVINAGLSGETTASGNSRIDWVLKNEISVFILELGANDGLRGIPTKETRKNLQEIIDKVLARYPEAKIVLAGMMVPPNMGEDYSQDFSIIFPEIAQKKQNPADPFPFGKCSGRT